MTTLPVVMAEGWGNSSAALAILRPAVKATNQSNYTNDLGTAAVNLTVNSSGVAPLGNILDSGDLSVSVGQNAKFTVSVTGEGLMRYAWKKLGVGFLNPSGQDSSVLTLVNVSSANAGLYSVTVSNAGGSSESRAMRLTVSGSDAVDKQHQRPELFRVGNIRPDLQP